MKVMNKYIAIKTHIDGAPRESDFELKVEPLSVSVEAGSNDVIVKTLYVSIDPYQIIRMKDFSSSQTAINFSAAIIPGGAIDAYGVGRVVASGHPNFEKDDLVTGVISWGEYSLAKGAALLNKLDPMGFPLSYHVGILGFSGLTAYGGFFQVCNPKKGEKVFVSAASGSVGNLVGQYAKLFGCYVVGCAEAIKRYFPDDIDIYFDNVGAEILEASVANMNTFGRVAVCGVISEYTDARKRAAPNMLDVVHKRITIRGFLAADLMKGYTDFISTTTDYLRNGKVHVLEDISLGVDSVPAAFMGLFRSDNVGKKIVQISDE